MYHFALIGAAGYVAPRHIKAIRDTGHELVAACDPSDSVGILDSYFPNTAFFTEFERFDRHLEKIKRAGKPADYIVVCSPNYLHDAHVRYGLRYGADVICEKPLVLNPWNLEALRDMEAESGRKINTILQLRLHPALIALKKEIEQQDTTCEVELTYITARGNWYFASWKGDVQKSGGIATNIGIHFFDLLIWLFGAVRHKEVHIQTHDRAAGYLAFEKATVKWFMSINPDTLPESQKANHIRTYRSIVINQKAVEFSEGFTDLHTLSYQEILNNKGFGTQTVSESIELAHQIRVQQPIGLTRLAHPLAALPLTEHPFE
jgi:UDP-N-acetyl-2-amino-2-deoxyglucuronate dehydrogenase